MSNVKSIRIEVEYTMGALVLDGTRPEKEGFEQRAWDRIAAAVDPYELQKSDVKDYKPLYAPAPVAYEEAEESDTCDCGCCDEEETAKEVEVTFKWFHCHC